VTCRWVSNTHIFPKNTATENVSVKFQAVLWCTDSQEPSMIPRATIKENDGLPDQQGAFISLNKRYKKHNIRLIPIIVLGSLCFLTSCANHQPTAKTSRLTGSFGAGPVRNRNHTTLLAWFFSNDYLKILNSLKPISRIPV